MLGCDTMSVYCGIPTESKPSGAVIYKAFCLDVAQGHMNGAPNEN